MFVSLRIAKNKKLGTICTEKVLGITLYADTVNRKRRAYRLAADGLRSVRRLTLADTRRAAAYRITLIMVLPGNMLAVAQGHVALFVESHNGNGHNQVGGPVIHPVKNNQARAAAYEHQIK